MEIKIIKKEIPRNVPHKVNKVYFSINDENFYLPIIYFITFKERKNVFLCDGQYKKIINYVKEKYNISEKEFQKLFLRKLYKYSNGKGLNFEDLV